MGETRVDLVHLLEDLRDAYTGSIEETILTEAVANALDSGAVHIRFLTDAATSSLTIVDDGSGMQRRDLARYHDLATSTKTRGQGIGFAGVGIKLGLLVCTEVVTESRRGKSHVASVWRLASRRRAPWKWTTPPGLVTERGTAVRLTLSSALSPLLDPGFVDHTVRRHFLPLFDPAFSEMLSSAYPDGVRFSLNDIRLDMEPPRGERVSVAIRMARKRKPVAVGYLARHEVPLPEDEQGLGISTFGKVIKRGWDWVGLTPAAADRINGLIEAPALAAVLTLSKSDFIRSGARGALYLAYRKAIQEALATPLAAWSEVIAPPERPKPLRIPDLEDVLHQLSKAFPLLGALVERRRGGQTRLPLAPKQSPLDLEGDVAPGLPEPGQQPMPSPENPAAEPQPAAPPPPPEPHTGSGVLDPASSSPRRRAGRLGLDIRFEARPDDPEVARLIEATVWINDAHPAYLRALASRSIGYHLMVSVMLALAPLAVAPAKEHEFITAFLSQWGAALDAPRRKRRR